ncbi:MAG: hypothetical protein PHC68_04095, partial [Syntrophorhabdaceae bacterium]|nr:hypothetical protein [Syntrophorhabdaceae bacterium]
REALYNTMRSLGMREAPNAYGLERSKILGKTKLMVNAQQYSLSVIAPLRFAIAAAHKLPVLTETVAIPWPHVIGHDLWQASIDTMPIEAARLLANPELLRQLGDNLHHRLCVEWTFRKGVEEALNETH